MSERFVHVDVFVDTTDPEQLSALHAFLLKVGENEKKRFSELVAPEAPANSGPAKPAEEPAKPARSTRQSKSKPAAEPAKPAEEPAKAEEPAETQVPAPEEKEYKIEEVREKLKEKVSEHREAIKSKLTELGAPNVSSLDPSKYAEFVNFLEGLE